MITAGSSNGGLITFSNRNAAEEPKEATEASDGTTTTQSATEESNETSSTAATPPAEKVSAGTQTAAVPAIRPSDTSFDLPVEIPDDTGGLAAARLRAEAARESAVIEATVQAVLKVADGATASGDGQSGDGVSAGDPAGDASSLVIQQAGMAYAGGQEASTSIYDPLGRDT